jgi:iron complex transport system substrate-binding protein
MSKPIHPRRPGAALRVVAVLVGLTLVSACSSDDSGDDEAAAATTEGASSDTVGTEATFPVTIDNCGESVTVDEAPTAAVTMNQGATEIMLALGLEDQMVGTAYLDDAVSPEWEDAYDSVPVLAEEYPSREVLLAEEPDFVYGSYASAFGDEGVGDRGALLEQGAATYLSPNDCRADEGIPITFDDVFAEIREIGRIFGVGDRAEQLVADSQAELDDAAEQLPDDTTILWYDSGTDAPFVGGCCGAPAMIIDALGAENVYADLEGSWGDGSWETAVAADPDAIVLIDASWDTIDSKLDTLGTEPMASMTAVTGEVFGEVPFSASTPGVRNVSAVVDLAAQLGSLLGG